MLQVQSYKALSVSESNLSQSMPAHESALIHVAIDTVQFPLPVYCHISKSLPSLSTGSRLVYCAIISL